MRIDLKNIASVLIDKYIIILFLIFALTVLSGLGLSNFKLDASSDALVLENDESLKTYREAEDEFGDSSFLIVIFIITLKYNLHSCNFSIFADN